MLSNAQQRNMDTNGGGYMPKVFAHRGFSATAPENTLAAFQAALKAGAEGFELDVQMTRDGQVVVIHDEKVNRTTDGVGWVKDYTLAELRKLDAGAWFDAEYAGQKVPLLSEVLELLTHNELQLNVELKSGLVHYPGLEQAVLDLVARFNMRQRVIVSSFNHFALRDMRTLDPDIELGVLYMEGMVDPWLYAKHLKAQALHPFYPTIIPEIVQGARQHGLAIRPFTVDRPEDVKALLAAKVDAIITNRPDLVLELRREVPK